MKVKILRKKPNELKMEIEGENHTFCNVFQKVLLEDDTIEMASYDIPHPLISNPVVYVLTKGRRRPKAALQETAKKLQKLNKDFRMAFEKAFEEWRKS